MRAGKNAKRFDMRMLHSKSEDDKGREQPGVCSRERLVIKPESYGKRKGQWRRSGEQ